MAVAARPRFGARDLVYAVLDESTDVSGGTATYGTIKPLAGLGKISVNPNNTQANLWGDDVLQHTADTNGIVDVQFDLNDCLPEAYAELMGHTYANGTIIEGWNDQSPWVAIGFKATRTNVQGSSTPTFDYFWLYKGKMRKPEMSLDTKKESINFQVQSFSGNFTALTSNYNWRIRVRTDDANVGATLLSNFFTAIPLTASADLGALSCTMAESTTNLTFTFAKVGGGNHTINTSTFVIGTTALVFKSGSAVAGTGVWSGQGTASPVYTFTPTVAFGANLVQATVTREIKDTNGVSCTVKTTVVDYSD